MKVSTQLQSSWSLLDSVEAVKNWKALLLLAGTLILAIYCLWTFYSPVRPVGNFLTMLSSFGVLLYGTSAVGIMLMDTAKAGESRSVSAALLASAVTTHNFILVILGALLSFGALLLVCTVLLSLGKIPGLGSLFDTLMLPASTIILGVAYLGLMVVVFPLAAAAVWTGEPTLRVCSNLYAIFRQRFMTVLVKQVLLGFLSILVSWAVIVLLFSGLIFTIFLLASTSAPDPRMGGMGMGGMGMLGLFMGDWATRLESHSAGLFGLVGLTLLLPWLISMQGACTIYLDAIRDLDLKGSQDWMMGTLADVKRKLEQAKEQHAPSTAAPVVPPVAPAVVAAAADPAAPVCPICRTAIVPGDVFCGECGHRLK